MSLSLDAPKLLSPSPENVESDWLRATRPSLLDPFLPSEPGLGQCTCMPNVVVLYVVNRPVAIIQATRMDQTSLDSWLDRIRSRMPRTWVEA